MRDKKRSSWRDRIVAGLMVFVVAALIFSLVGCERPKRSKSEGLPTVEPAAATSTPGGAVSASPTKVSVVDATDTPGIAAPSPTLAVEAASPTPFPSATKASVSATKYTVQEGDTLYSIAQQYGLSVDELMALNDITDPSSLTVGQVLVIAEGSAEGPTAAPTPGGTTDGTVYVVQKGDNLFRIALRHGTTAQTLASYNNIVNPALIYVGQKIAIPPGGSDPGSSTGQVHVVQPGENLYRIALRYNTTPWAIAVANGLSNTNLIYVGQRLQIP